MAISIRVVSSKLIRPYVSGILGIRHLGDLAIGIRVVGRKEYGNEVIRQSGTTH